MTRKLTALIFITALITILALKHPVLAYCTSEHELTTISFCPLEPRAEDTQQGCCDSCAIESDQTPSHNSSAPCTSEIAFEAGEFTWENTVYPPKPSKDFKPIEILLVPSDKCSLLNLSLACTALQNAPPPRLPLPSITGTFRL